MLDKGLEYSPPPQKKSLAFLELRLTDMVLLNNDIDTVSTNIDSKSSKIKSGIH